MNTIMKFFSIVIISMLCSSCNSKKIVEKTIKTDESTTVRAIKFMGSVNEYPRSIDKKIFWNYPEEHAFIILKNDDFIEEVKRLENTTPDKFSEYNYAFIVNTKKEVDTLYSDNTLKAWIFNKKGNSVYYYDEEGKIANALRSHYSFFKDCW